MKSQPRFAKAIAFIDLQSAAGTLGFKIANTPKTRIPSLIYNLQKRVAEALSRSCQEPRVTVSMRLYYGWRGRQQDPNQPAAYKIFTEILTDSCERRFSNIMFQTPYLVGSQLAFEESEELWFTFRGGSIGQKMVDSMICCDALTAHHLQLCKYILIFSEDDDMIPPSHTLKKLGAYITLIKTDLTSVSDIFSSPTPFLSCVHCGEPS